MPDITYRQLKPSFKELAFRGPKAGIIHALHVEYVGAERMRSFREGVLESFKKKRSIDADLAETIRRKFVGDFYAVAAENLVSAARVAQRIFGTVADFADGYIFNQSLENGLTASIGIEGRLCFPMAAWIRGLPGVEAVSIGLPIGVPRPAKGKLTFIEYLPSKSEDALTLQQLRNWPYSGPMEKIETVRSINSLESTCRSKVREYTRLGR